MGCAVSSEPSPGTTYPKQQQQQQQQQQQRPVASVTPQQQQQQVQNQQQPAQHLKAPKQQAPPPTTPDPHTDEPEEKSDIKIKKVEINKENIQKYIEMDRKIRENEATNSIKKLKSQKKDLSDLQATEKQLEEHYKKCLHDTAKEKADVENLKQPNVKSFFKDQSQYDAKMSKEEEEYLEALNKQEVAQKEYQGLKGQREQLAREITSAQAEMDKLLDLYRQQDEMLAGFFNGKYGSNEENRLEAELDMLLDRKQRILVAKQKWQNGRLLTHHACNQLAFSVHKWGAMARVHPSNVQLRYQMATETRNNLIAASQNIGNTHRYLNTISFPYLKPDEVETLNKAIRHIYIDMQSQERYGHAAECYNVTHRRCAALLQWFDYVIDKTIMNDMERAMMESNSKEKALRLERLRLLQEKYKETTGKTITLTDNFTDEADGVDMSQFDVKSEVALAEADKVSIAGDLPQGEGGNEELDVTGDDNARMPTPLPLTDLAPPPSDAEIFGNIENLKKQHEQEMEEFSKAQGVNKARMEQGLQEKLCARKSRRARQAEMDSPNESEDKKELRNTGLI